MVLLKFSCFYWEPCFCYEICITSEICQNLEIKMNLVNWKSMTKGLER